MDVPNMNQLHEILTEHMYSIISDEVHLHEIKQFEKSTNMSWVLTP